MGSPHSGPGKLARPLYWILTAIMRLLIVCSILLACSLLTEGKQRKRPKLEGGQGIEPCKPSTSKRFLEYGYGQLLEAGIYDIDGKTPLKKRGLGVSGLDMKIDKEYRIKAKFTDADFGTQQAFKAVNKRDLIGVQDCSQALKGSRGKDADGCKWVTDEYKDACPISNKG